MQKFLTINEVRALLGNRARSTIYKDIEAGRLPEPMKLGGRIYWPESELDAHLRALRNSAGDARAEKT